ncbi:hypothetical protein MMC12_001356 [Toensbergia leucococca]|nr:hypothetical protein [Toensbergia leucococca]
MEFTIPFSSRTDPRIPYPRGTIPPEPIDLVDRDGYVSHSVTLLSPKCSAFSALVKLAVEKREETRHLYAEDVVERAVENNKLMHVSDGPRGGIWVIEKGRQDLAACLALDMPKGEEGGWEVLGVGGGGSEGKIFMIHGCGFGGPAIEKEVKGGEGNANGIKLKGKGKEKSIEVNAKNNEMQRNGIEAKGKENKGTKRRNRDRLRDLVGKMIDEVLLV